MLSSQRCARSLPSRKQRKSECRALGIIHRTSSDCVRPRWSTDPLVKTEVAAVVRGGQRVPGPSLRPSGRSVCASWFVAGVIAVDHEVATPRCPDRPLAGLTDPGAGAKSTRLGGARPLPHPLTRQHFDMSSAFKINVNNAILPNLEYMDGRMDGCMQKAING